MNFAAEPAVQFRPPLQPSARSLLLTLLGEFALKAEKPIWMSQVLRALALVDVAEKTARQAINRTMEKGWIRSERQGRLAALTLTESGRELITRGSNRLRTLSGSEWDQHWLILHLPMTNFSRTQRAKIERGLSWLGFGSPSPCLWINPRRDVGEGLKTLLQNLAPETQALAFVGRSVELGGGDVDLARAAWDLDAIADHYVELAGRFRATAPRTGDEYLSAHVLLVNQLQQLPFLDPGLPPALLPAALQIHTLIEELRAIRRAWRKPAIARWTELSFDPEG